MEEITKNTRQNSRSLKRTAREIEPKEDSLEESLAARAKNYETFMARNKSTINQIQDGDLFSDYKVDTNIQKRNLKLEAKIQQCFTNAQTNETDLKVEENNDNSISSTLKSIGTKTKQEHNEEQKLKPCIKVTNYPYFSPTSSATTVQSTPGCSNVPLNPTIQKETTDSNKPPPSSVPYRNTIRSIPKSYAAPTGFSVNAVSPSSPNAKNEMKNKINPYGHNSNASKIMDEKPIFQTSPNDSKTMHLPKFKEQIVTTNKQYPKPNKKDQNKEQIKSFTNMNQDSKGLIVQDKISAEMKNADRSINYCFINPEFRPYVRETRGGTKNSTFPSQDNTTQTDFKYKIKDTNKCMSKEETVEKKYGSITKSKSEEKNNTERFTNNFNTGKSERGYYPYSVRNANSKYNELKTQFYRFPQKSQLQQKKIFYNESQKRQQIDFNENKGVFGQFKTKFGIKDGKNKRFAKTRSNDKGEQSDKEDKNTPPKKNQKNEQIKNFTPNEEPGRNNQTTGNSEKTIYDQPNEEKEMWKENLKDDDGNVAININLPIGQIYKINAPNLFSVIISDGQVNRKDYKHRPSKKSTKEIPEKDSTTTLDYSTETSYDSDVGNRRRDRTNKLILGPKRKFKKQFRDHQIQEYNRYLKSMMYDEDVQENSKEKIEEQNNRLKTLEKEFRKTRKPDLLSDEYTREKRGNNAFVQTNIIENGMFDEDGKIFINPQNKQTHKQNVPEVCFELYNHKFVPWTIIQKESEEEHSDVDTSNKNVTKQKPPKYDKNYKNILNMNLDTERSLKNIRNKKREARNNEKNKGNKKNFLYQNQNPNNAFKDNKNIQFYREKQDDRQTYFNDKTKLIDRAESDDECSSGNTTPTKEPKEVLFCTSNKNVISNLVGQDEDLSESKTVIVYSQVTRKPSNEDTCFKGLRYHETKISETTRVSVSSKKKKGFINWLKKFF